jgi:diguanylate cyclase (GGDEF)-like protein/PAS domain S-box-containing protein
MSENPPPTSVVPVAAARQQPTGLQRILESLLSTTADMLVFVDHQGICRVANEAFIDDWRRPDRAVIDEALQTVVGKATFASVFAPGLARCRQNGACADETEFDDRGRRRILQLRYRHCEDDDGRAGTVICARDLTSLREAQDRVRQAARVFSATVEGVTITDLDGNILEVNDAFCHITGYSREEAIGSNPRLLQSGRHSRDFYAAMWRTLQRRHSWRGEIWNRRKTGETYPEMLTINAVLDDSGQATGYVAVFSDITAIKQTEERLEHLAHHDPLTQLPNRLLFNARLRQSLSFAARTRGRLAVLFVDIDRFKHMNDSFGHTAGDTLLVQIAERLRAIVRAEDTVSRISGDEFIVLLENVERTDHVTAVVRKIMQIFTRAFDVEGSPLRTTCSIGVAVFPEDGADASILLRNADTAMHRAKQDGRNAYQFYTREMTAAAFEQAFLENALRSAIQNRQFRLVYQPQLRLADRSIAGAEALLRWHHPDQGLIMPDRFIPIAEQSGLIREIGDWVLEEACRQAQRWIERGVDFGRIAVNVSGKQIQQADFAERVQAALRRYRLPAERLEIELTESFIMDKVDASLAQLNQLDETGVSLSVDDFGTGYSSLSYLKQLPVDKLKIDRSFISDIPQDSNDLAITDAIIALSDALGLEVVAEGVETQVQADLLRAKGCRTGQGYLFSKPLPAVEFEHFVRATVDVGNASMPRHADPGPQLD